MKRYKITMAHGESGVVYYVVDTQAPEAEQPAVIASYATAKWGGAAHKAAVKCRDAHNDIAARDAVVA